MKAPKLTLSRGDASLLGRACILWAVNLGSGTSPDEPQSTAAARVETHDQLLYLQARLCAYLSNYPEFELEEGGEDVDRSDIPF